MKNFFKKLSFVLASAMVVTSLYAPASTEAAAKNGILVKGGKVITKKSIFVGGDKINFDYKIGKFKNKGAMGKWSTSNKSIIKVNKDGVVTAVGTGDATLYYKVKKNKKNKLKKNLTYKVKVTAFARATELTIPASDKAITVKVGEKKEIMPMLKDKVKGVKNTYKLYAMTDNATDVAVSVMDNMKVVVEAKNPTATSATITVFAAQKNSEKEAMVNKYKVEDSFKVDVKPNLSAEQKAANKILVKGMDLSTDVAMYVVKNDKGVVLSLKKNVAVNEAKTEATLESEMPQILVGKYNLSYNKSEPVEFEVTKALVREIKIMPEDKAILDAANANKAYVNYKIFDQFGNDVTSTVPHSNIHAAASIAATVSTGKITFDATPNALRPLVDKISVTLVEKNTGVNATAVLTVGDKAKVWDAEFKGLYNETDKKVVTDLSEADKTKTVKLLFMLKDQYDNAYEEAAQIDKQLNVTTVGLGNITVTNQNGALVTVDGKKYMAYALTLTNMRQGEVMVNAIGLNNGKMATGKFNVVPATKVNEITVQEGPMGVYNGQKNELTYTATDLDGKPVTDYKVLSSSDVLSKIKMEPSAKLAWENKDGKAVLVLDLSGVNALQDVNGNTAGVQTQILTFLTATNKFSTATINVNNKRMPIAFLGVKSDVATGLTQVNGKTLEIKMKDLRFQDQYGREMSAKDIVTIHGANLYGFKVKTTDLNDSKNANVVFDYDPTMTTEATVEKALTANDDDVVVKATVKKLDGTAKADVKLQLGYDADGTTSGVNFVVDENKYGAERTVTLSNVAVDDIKNFAVEDPKVQPAHDLYDFSITPIDDYYFNLRPSVYGYFEGNKITLDDSLFEVFDGVDQETVLVPGQKYVKVPSKKTIPAGEMTAKAKFKVIIKNSAITNVEKEYTYSKELPKVGEVKKLNDTVVAVADNSKTIGWEHTNEKLKDKFKIFDQYGKEFEIAPYITFSVKEEDKAKMIDLKNNGTLTAEFKADSTAEFEVGIKLIFPGTTYKFEGKIKVKKNA